MPFAVGSKVWLEATNLKLPSNLMPKLAPRRYGPFEVIAQISKVVYKLSLPSHWKIHNVFHASLLTPYHETQQHGPNFLEPPPDVIEGETEWEVERILRERTYGRWKKKQYLVRWKGYSPSHDEWIPEEDLHTPDLLVEFHSSSSNIRTLQVDDKPPCSFTQSTHHDHNSSPLFMTMSNRSMAFTFTPESIKEDTPSPTTQPSPNLENVPPASSTLSVPSNPITRSSAGVQSPRISIDNLSMSSTSPLPIRPPSLAPPLLTVPTTTTATSSQDEIVLDVNPPPFPIPHHPERRLALTPLALSNPDPPLSDDKSQNQQRS